MSAERRTGRARREIPQNSRHTKQELAQTQIFQPRKNQKTKSVTKLIDETQEHRNQNSYAHRPRKNSTKAAAYATSQPSPKAAKACGFVLR